MSEEMSPEQAELTAKVNKAKDQFTQAVLEYRGLLKDNTLPSNKTQEQKDRQNRILQDLNSYAGKLEELNVGEGIFSLAFIALHSLLIMHDEMNELRFQNFMLHKKTKAMQVKIDSLEGYGETQDDTD